jgi:hypothetical protein
MATYYWVGGSGTWNATDTTNWASTSGGAGGAGVPTSADDVVFDGNSDTGAPFTVTITGTIDAPAVCNNFDANTGSALDQSMTLTNTTAATYLDCYGSLTLPATNFTWTGLSSVRLSFKATTTGKTITTNGVTLSGVRIIFDGVGGEWTLGSALTWSATISNFSLFAGSFNTGNYNMTNNGGSTGIFLSPGGTTAVRSFTCGSSTISTSSIAPINAGVPTNLTFDAGTANFVFSANSLTLNGGGLTFYNVTFSGSAGGTTTINGANTFNDLTQTSRNATGTRSVVFVDNQTINGTLTLGATNTAIRRVIVRSGATGTQQTITLNGTLATLADVDFRDIATAGTVGTWTGTRLGDCLNNSGITFDAPKTVYRVGTGDFSADQWAATSGGSPAADQFPLAQDTMVFDANTTTGTHTIDRSWQLGTLDCSAVTSAVTIVAGTSVYGNITLNSDVTLTGTGTWTLAGQGTTQTITSAGVTFTQPIEVDSPGGTVLLADNLTTGLDVTLEQGTLDLDDNTLTCRRFISSNSNTRSIAFGTGKIVVTGNAGTVLNTNTLNNFSYTGTPDIELNYSGSTGTRTIATGLASGGATESNVLNIKITNGSDTIATSSSIELRNLDFTGFSGTWGAISTFLRCYGNLTFSSNMTLPSSNANLIFLATSGTQQVTANGKTLDFPITKNGAGTLQLQDDLTMGSTRAFTLTDGTLDLNSKTLTAGSVSTSNSNTRSIDFKQNGVINCEGAWTATTATGLTYAGRGRIKMSSASAKTFAGGGAAYPVLEQAGAGTLTITGANTFDDITNSNATASQITFPANTTTSVKKFTVKGSAGNLVSLRSSTTGTKFTIQTV